MKPATLANFSLQGKIYLVRTMFCLATLMLLVFSDTFCKESSGNHLWLIIGGLLYPQIGHLLLGRIDISRRRGHALFLVDGLFVGGVITALNFALLPSIVLTIISLFNWTVVGGTILVVAGSSFMFIGMLIMGIDPNVIPLGASESCTITNWLASLFAIGYFLVVARIIHKLIGELRLKQIAFQAHSDSADSTKTMAEQALLAVLPTSKARQLEEHGSVTTETTPDTTLLLLDIRNQDETFPSLDSMRNAVLVCDSILTRHDIELIKTFGNHILASSCKESGASDAIKAFQEIDNFYKDHVVENSTLRGILHQGSVTMGLVQPQRLNIDLFGPAIDELARLAEAAASRHLSGLIVTAIAKDMLKDQPEGKLLQENNLHITCYRYSA